MIHQRLVTVLVADDDLDDREMIRDAMSENRIHADLRFVNDGEDLMDYLYLRGKYTGSETAPRPGLILLDLNMPRKDGREALAEIKAHPELKTIPVIVLTTSRAQEDIYRTYDLGVNSFIAKPVKFDGLVKLMGELGNYWLQIVELPPSQKVNKR